MRSKFQNTTLRKDLQTLRTHNETLIHNEQILQTQIRESSEQYTKLLQENARLQAYMDSNATLLQTLEGVCSIITDSISRYAPTK